MIKKLTSKTKKSVKTVTAMVSDTTVMNFMESTFQEKNIKSAVKRISAHDLFSLFTAEIIEKPTVFVR